MEDYEPAFGPSYAGVESLPFDRARAIEVCESAEEVERIFHLFRFFDARGAIELLNHGVNSPSSGMRLYALVSLIAHDQPVDAEKMEELARMPWARLLIWKMLGRIGRLDQFPPAFHDQQSLAEAEMANWVQHPMEMGQYPEEIEFLRVAETNSSEYGRCACYFFRFRHSEFLEGKWFVGMAGPYSTGAEPKLHGSWTFSHFNEYSEESLDNAMQRLLDRDREDDAKEATEER